jgi:predicted enzyme related to lactoylglutathione lyase
MLFVKDFVRMREFYGRVLEAAPVNTEWTDSWALFDLEGSGFALHAIPADAGGVVSGERKAVKLIFAVDDVPSELMRLEAIGVKTIGRTWQNPGESCDCLDPEGNVFQIAARASLPRLFGRS